MKLFYEISVQLYYFPKYSDILNIWQGPKYTMKPIGINLLNMFPIKTRSSLLEAFFFKKVFFKILQNSK